MDVDLKMSLKVYPVDPGVISYFLVIKWGLFKGQDFQDRQKNILRFKSPEP